MTKNDHIYQIYILYCGLANFLKIYIKYMVIGHGHIKSTRKEDK